MRITGTPRTTGSPAVCCAALDQEAVYENQGVLRIRGARGEISQQDLGSPVVRYRQEPRETEGFAAGKVATLLAKAGLRIRGASSERLCGQASCSSGEEVVREEERGIWCRRFDGVDTRVIHLAALPRGKESGMRTRRGGNWASMTTGQVA
jgi:hypothetical protein